MCFNHGSVQAAQVTDSHFACCPQSTFVQDQVCSPINITPGIDSFTQDLYKANVNPAKLFTTGYISITNAPADRVYTVNWLLGGVVVETDTVIPGTALTFTKSGFDTIQLSVTASINVTPNITGEFCVTARYPVS